MSGRSAIIIGAGLGGLLCGRILSRKGFQAAILEQGAQAGGALQTFVRDGVRFDTGFHSVGGLGPGEPLAVCFKSLGLDGLPWRQMEPDEIVGGSCAFLRLSSGWDVEREHVLKPFSQSVWRLEGGGKTLVDALSDGLDIRLKKKVVSIEDRCVACADGSSFRGDIVISDIHPLTTFRMVRDRFRPAYLRRLESLENGPGATTVYIKLKPEAIPFINHSIFLDDSLMIHFGELASDGSAISIDLLAFDGTPEDMIRHAAKRLPKLPESIENYWTSTPSTWERYTGTPGGSAYGILKRRQEDFLSPVTPLPWLYLTGQNIGLHGILGTTISAINTCNSILK
ncbi:MAG: FAD-dependent oxidoreductase [Bacteroidales bacterium]|nr:FAD-dependent oxidoreductase [Bacteroidales bacterium]